MRQVQVTVPVKFKDSAREIVEEYSSDVSSSKVEKDDHKALEFSASVESEDIDELTEELKGIEELESGDLSIRVLDQETLIQKGQKNRGGSGMLSQEELHSKAQDSGEFSKAEWGLIAVSSAIAAYGLALDNVIVVIGAMMLAPILSPFVSGAFSLVVGDKSLMRGAAVSGFKSVLLAVIIAFAAVIPFPVQMNPTLELVARPNILSVLLSLLVGSAAALSFSTGLRDQIAGVAVAIALVPPVASLGIGLKTGDLVFASNAASVAAINILSVVIAGFLTFRLLGLKPSNYYREKEAEKIRYVLPVALVALVLVSVPVAYTSFNTYQDYLDQQDIRGEADSFFGKDLINVEFRDSTVRIVAAGNYSEEAFESRLPPKFDAELISVQKTG